MVITATQLTAVIRAVAPLGGSDSASRTPEQPAREHTLAVAGGGTDPA